MPIAMSSGCSEITTEAVVCSDDSHVNIPSDETVTSTHSQTRGGTLCRCIRASSRIDHGTARMPTGCTTVTGPSMSATTCSAAPSPAISNERTPEASPAGDFVRQKGALRLPTRGVVSNRFGSPRQEGSTWKGLFIRAPQGSEVKAIAGGRVVFADWMRGFGNLLIVDHGDNYLSIYGYSDAVLKDVGDRVRGGDSIATAGSSGGNAESGLYFELRHRGEPIDPLKWVSLK